MFKQFPGEGSLETSRMVEEITKLRYVLWLQEKIIPVFCLGNVCIPSCLCSDVFVHLWLQLLNRLTQRDINATMVPLFLTSNIWWFWANSVVELKLCGSSLNSANLFVVFFSYKEQTSDLLKLNYFQKWNSYSLTRYY